MKKILLIALLFWTNFVQSQTSRIVYTNVLHGDTLFQVKITETGVPDSVIRFNYVKRDVLDSLLVNGVMTYTYTQVTDTIPYTYHYFRVTNTVRDSVQMNKLAIQPPLQAGANIKTINSESPLGSGNINVSGGAAAWADITGKPSTFPPDAHNHDAVYSAISHNHTGVYQPVGSYLVAADIAGKQNNITLTTTGTSGAATFVGSTLNIPNYATGGGGSPTFVNLASNFSSTSTTPATVTGWSFAVTTGKTYRIEVIADYQTAATTTGGIIAVNLSGGATGSIRGMAHGSVSAAAVATELAIPIRTLTGAGSSLTTTGVSAINTPHFLHLLVTFTCTGTGTFNIQWATEVAASASQLNANSSLIYQALN